MRRRAASQRITDEIDTPKRRAAARRLMPPSTAESARARKSIESAFPIIAVPISVTTTMNQFIAALGIPRDSTRKGAALEREFKDYVRPVERPREFIDHELRPSAEAFEKIIAPDQSQYKRYRLLKGLNLLDNQDWQPPVIKFMTKENTNDNDIVSFLNKIDRLAYFLFITRANVNDRLTRYALVLSELEIDDYRIEQSEALELTDEEKIQFKQALNGVFI